MVTFEDYKRHLNGKGTGNKFTAKCPCHEDNEPSFSMTEKDGNVIFKCHAGCTQEQIVAYFKSVGLWESKNGKRDSVKKSRKFKHKSVGEFWANISEVHTLVEVYEYLDENEKLTGFKARFSPKTFRHYTRTEEGKNKATKAPSIPYRLPQILKAISEGKTVHCFEGEKDANNAVQLSIPATSFGGATDDLPLGLFPKFKGTSWVIWADNDAPGLKRAQRIALALHNVECKIKVAIPKVGKDFSDWLESGIEVKDIATALKETPQWLPVREQMTRAAADGIFDTSIYKEGSEAWAGVQLAHINRNRLRYVAGMNQWLSFDKVWKFDKARMHRERIKDLAPYIRENLTRFTHDLRPTMEKMADRCESDKGVTAIANIASSIPKLVVPATALDDSSTKHLLACQSGLINLATGQLLPHSPEHMITHISPYEVDLSANADEFEAFLNDAFQIPEVTQWMLAFLGYCLTGETTLQNFFLWVGETGTGKSQLQNVMRGLLGALCGEVDASAIAKVKQRSPGVESDLASMRGKRTVMISELTAIHRLDERILKALTGKDTIKVKEMARDRFEMRALAKLIMTANERPPLSDDSAIARRIIEVRWLYKPKSDVKDYAEKLLASIGPKILGLLVKYAAIGYQNPEILELPQVMRAWADDFIEEANTVKWWSEERLAPFTGHFLTNSLLFEDFSKFCKNNGLHNEYSTQSLKNRLAKLGFKSGQNSRGDQRGLKDVMLRA